MYLSELVDGQEVLRKRPAQFNESEMTMKGIQHNLEITQHNLETVMPSPDLTNPIQEITTPSPEGAQPSL